MGIFSTVIKGVLLSPKHIHKYHQANRFKEAVMELSRYHGFQSYYIGNKLDCWEPFSSNIDIESEMFAGLGVDSNTNRRIIVVGGLGQISIKGLFEQNGVQQIATRSNA